jgi:hypothetical protein
MITLALTATLAVACGDAKQVDCIDGCSSEAGGGATVIENTTTIVGCTKEVQEKGVLISCPDDSEYFIKVKKEKKEDKEEDKEDKGKGKGKKEKKDKEK